MTGSWRAELSALLPGVRFDEPLSHHTTFKIGGPADAFAEPGDRDQLACLLRFAREKELPVFVLGWGSNLLVRDGGIRGVVLRLGGEFLEVRFPGGGVVEVGAAARLPMLVLRCAQRSLSGLEPLVGVPGTFGGALVMNAGTREAEIGNFVREVEVFDEQRLEPVRIPASELRFGYRTSSLAGRLVLGGRLELPVGDKDVIIARVREQQARRQRTQPIHTFNVGSTFKNPPGQFAAKLIEEAGLKGRSVGGARVSALHANFIENAKEASAADVLALVELVREAVRERFGVGLELEMKVVGEAASGAAQA